MSKNHFIINKSIFQKIISAVCALSMLLVFLSACQGKQNKEIYDLHFGEKYSFGESKQLTVRIDSVWCAPELHPSHPSPTLYRYLPEQKDKMYAVLRTNVENSGEEEIDLGPMLSGTLSAPGQKDVPFSFMLESEWGDSFVETGSLILPANSSRNLVLFAQISEQTSNEGGLIANVKVDNQYYSLDWSSYRLEKLKVGESIIINDEKSLTLLNCFIGSQLRPSRASGIFTGLEASEDKTLVQVSVELSGADFHDIPLVGDINNFQPFSMMRESADGQTILDNSTIPDDTQTQTLHFLLEIDASDASKYKSLLLHVDGKSYELALT